MEQEIIKEMSELKTEMKYINKTLWKVEKVLENQAVLLEKQSVANNRILDLERADEKINDKIKNIDDKIDKRVRKLEDWQIKIITLSGIVATCIWFVLNKFF